MKYVKAFIVVLILVVYVIFFNFIISREGKKDGPKKVEQASKTLKEKLVFKRNKKNGPFKEYYDNGTIFREGTYKKGEITGILKQYGKDGKLRTELTYKDGKIIFERSFYGSGQVSEERVFKNEKNVSWRQFDEKGNITAEISDSWGTYISPDQVGAIQLTRVEQFSENYQGIVFDVIDKLAREQEKPSEYFIKIQPSEDKSQMKVEVWHYNSFLDIYKNTLGNPEGKNHIIFYDYNKNKIIKSVYRR